MASRVPAKYIPQILRPRASTSTSTSTSCSRFPSPAARVHNLPLQLQLQSRSLSSGKRLRFIKAGSYSTPFAPVKKSILRRLANVFLIGIVSTSLGFAMAAAPVNQAAQGYLHPPTDEETLSMYTPEDASAQKVEDRINNHPLVVSLRAQRKYTESRPHLKLPEGIRNYSLTAGTLLGPDKVVVPPLVFSEEGGRSLVSILYLGKNLCGHPGIVHGGMLATILDEGMATCCLPALPNRLGMTASLNINYRAPAPAESLVVLRARTTKVEGRKAWVEGRIELLVGEGEKPVVLAEASALFIEPKRAALVTRAYPVR